MIRFISRHALIAAALATMIALPVALVRPSPSAALPSYAAATGQSCGACHVNPAGGGPRNAVGSAFEAIPSHVADPAGAWAQISGSSATPTATTTDTTTTTVTSTATTTPTAVTDDDDEDEVEVEVEDDDEGGHQPG
ncbi:MAG: hypothetical protein M1531_02940, partial [Chloroflexi bacterium]|nr:hypothetical protein [Chloroflexota bacterium]